MLCYGKSKIESLLRISTRLLWCDCEGALGLALGLCLSAKLYRGREVGLSILQANGYGRTRLVPKLASRRRCGPRLRKGVNDRLHLAYIALNLGWEESTVRLP
jgi:hypothetical protein